jgi:acetyl-CoA carboxylase carboxyltransferase component
MDRRSDSVAARVVELGGRRIVELRVEGGKHHGAVGEAGAEAMERAIRLATELGVPFVAWLDTTGADVAEGVSSLHGWGRCARALVEASGVVPTLTVVTGACVF